MMDGRLVDLTAKGNKSILNIRVEAIEVVFIKH